MLRKILLYLYTKKLIRVFFGGIWFLNRYVYTNKCIYIWERQYKHTLNIYTIQKVCYDTPLDFEKEKRAKEVSIIVKKAKKTFLGS